ncbi:hypothetical protein C8N25_13636 [Algoriphagus antarcticus]|uniref:Uncharacterized protein n=1 Tax=Algoriphagus antarcticus TaxID=238540 RepID=A0A3E0D8S9_9BACT|nr:hypothetical protein C8N25_13636 [Algoriphagus antarcticus]
MVTYKCLLRLIVELAIQKSNHFEEDLELLAMLFKFV